MNIASVDQIVGEYLIYRGFTQTFRSLEQEKARDRTKQFEVNRLVEAIFGYLNNFDVESFISLWDFLSKRFFFHLDSEHVQYSANLKADLLKYYLVHAVKTNKRDRLTEFFTMFSHEILTESGDSVGPSLGFRSWFVLPYMDEPERDPDFAVYFSSRWSEALRITIGNFLSIVLQSAPLPKLLLLEKWFHTDAQQEMRAQLSLSAQKVECLMSRLAKAEERLLQLRMAVKDLVFHVQKASVGANPSPRTNGNGGLFETDEDADAKRLKARELGQKVCRVATDCANKSMLLSAMPKEARAKELLGKDASRLFQKVPGKKSHAPGEVGNGRTSTNLGTGAGAGAGVGREREGELHDNIADLEANMVTQLQLWLKTLSV